jgi:4-hydroxy-tetrahydrodipicolinate reductase
MGRLLETRLLERGHQVPAVIEAFTPGLGKGGPLPSGASVYTSLEEAHLNGADAAMEFTWPDRAVQNLLFLAKEKIPVVAGTTGWYDKLPEVNSAVNAAGTSLIWSPNYSIGVNLFYRIAAHAAKLIDPFEDYDVAGMETHHNKKTDSPSGTAKILVERVLAKMTRKKSAVYDKLDRPPAPHELHYASVRVGSVPGTHSLVFDSIADSIEITHSARSREGFAAGAVLAAEWLTSKKRSGVFTLDDALNELLPPL